MATTAPVLLPGKLHGQRRPAGYHSRSRKELDMTEWVACMRACLHKNGWGLDCTKARLHHSMFYSLLWFSDTQILTHLLASPFLKNGFILLEWNYEKKTPTSSSCLVFCRICLFKEMTFRRCSWEVPNFSGLSSADSSDCCGKQTEEPKDLISPLRWAN